jgi:hypothetical protein
LSNRVELEIPWNRITKIKKYKTWNWEEDIFSSKINLYRDIIIITQAQCDPR